MAIQLAYYRQHKNFVLTYEPAMTRLFKKGRTETIRSCTIESSKWVLAMDDENFNSQDRANLLREACKKHQSLYLEAMYGDGKKYFLNYFKFLKIFKIFRSRSTSFRFKCSS